MILEDELKNIKKKAAEIVSQLTIEEKASLCSGADTWHTQNIDRIGLNSVMMCDGPHGLRKQIFTHDNLGLGVSSNSTCFPTASLSACSFDRELISEMGKAIAEECISEDVSVILGPGINMKRSPLCGRNFEYFSEDPLLSGELASAYVKGCQSKGVGVSLKHFAVNNQERRRMNVSAEIDERTLRELYLRAFEKVVKKANPYTIMCSYNKINNVYSSENKYLLTDILRNEWGYDGLVVSDWGAVNVRADGIKAGLDLEMPGNDGINDKKIVDAVNAGELDVNDLDKACINVVSLVLKCNLANELTITSEKKINEGHHELAVKVAEESMVLLKNDNNVLPIDFSKNVSVIGALAKTPRYQGAGSSKINPIRIDIPYDILNKNKVVKYCDGYTIGEENIEKDKELIEKSKIAASKSDYVIIFAGLPERYESEGFDRENMAMPENQTKLIKEVAAVNKNTVVVLVGGSPIEIPWIDDVNAVLLAYLGGEGIGQAVYNLLSGDTCPSGKLAETWPLNHTDCLSSKYFPGDRLTVQYREGIFTGYRYFDSVNKPVRFPFGYGLSYADFKYSNLSSNINKIYINDESDYDKNFIIQFNVENTSNIAAKNTILAFMSKESSSIVREKHKLIGFTKVNANKNESKSVSISINLEDFAYYDTKSKRFCVENGEYIISIGENINNLTQSIKINIINNFDKKLTKEERSVYKRLSDGIDTDKIKDSAFEKLLGRPVTKPALMPKRPFTMDNCLEDTQTTFAGKMLYKIASRLMVTESKNKEEGQDQMMLAVIREMPFHSLWVSSNGMISEEMMKSILDILNGHSLKGIQDIFKNIKS